MPHAKDFLLSSASRQFNTDLLWRVILNQPDREITDNIDIIMPTLSLIRVTHMAKNTINETIQKMVSKIYFIIVIYNSLQLILDLSIW